MAYVLRCRTHQRVAEDFMPSGLWWAAGLPNPANDNLKADHEKTQ